MDDPTRRPIILPDLGTDRVRFSLWYVSAGGRVVERDRIAEVVIAGATCEIAAPASGQLVTRAVRPNDPLSPAQVLGEIETEGS
jgi:pyruvate/2-oxoglutarate dehydrogenase complex dihydrolipoamide acyltransferase (E2) component